MRHPGNPPQPACVVSFFFGLRFIPAIPGSADLPRSLSSYVRAFGSRPERCRRAVSMLSDRCQTAVGMPPEYCLNAVRMLPVCPCRMLPAASEPPPELGRGFCDRVREFAAELRPWVLRSAFRNLQWKFRPCGFCQRLLPRAVSALRFRLRGPSLRSLSALSPRRDARSPRPARACRRRSPAPARRQRSSVRRR